VHRATQVKALEDAVDIARRAPVLAKQIGAVGDQAAGGDEVAIAVNRPIDAVPRLR
jgi:hypothetical protein